MYKIKPWKTHLKNLTSKPTNHHFRKIKHIKNINSREIINQKIEITNKTKK